MVVLALATWWAALPAEAAAPLVVEKARPAQVRGNAPGAQALSPARDARTPISPRLRFADALARPGARLGILRHEQGAWRPSRGASGERALLLRAGTVEDLALGKLARLSSPEAAARGVASVPFQDTLRVLVLRVDFLTDRSRDSTTGNGRFDLSPPDTIAFPVDPTPHNRAFYDSHMEALRRYYATATNGRLVLEWEVYPKADSAYHAGDMADYGPWRFSRDVFDRAYRMVRGLIAAADTQDPSIPWEKFDRVTVFHAGSDLQSDVRLDSPNDFPTFTIFLDDSLAIPVGSAGERIFNAAILPETANQDGYFAALNAVNAHEHGHNLFGWRDVYDVESGLPVCGEFTLMDTGNLVGTTVQVGDSASGRQFFAIGLLPPLADPYQRHLVWDDVPRTDLPAWGAVDALGPPQITGRATKVPLDSEEYLLLENRQDDLNGDHRLLLVRDPDTHVILGPGTADSLEYDFLIPGPGILVWHVDESVVGFDPPGRRADEFLTINGHADRRGLQIIEADALDDLGDFSSPFALGSPLDPWFVPNNRRLARDTRPPLVTNSGTDPHVSMEVLDSLQLSMRLIVRRDWQRFGWPVKYEPPKEGVEPLVIDFAEGRFVVFAGGDSALHGFRGNGLPVRASGDVLWRAPASLSPIAVLRHPTLGPLAVAVYPDPATLNDTTWATGGSWVVAVRADGTPAPGFPLKVPDVAGGPDWITAGPLVQLSSAGEPTIYVGTRSGSLLAVSADGAVTTRSLREIGSGATLGGSPILALASFARSTGTPMLEGMVAGGDSLGRVGIDGLVSSPPADVTFGGLPVRVGSPGGRPLLAWVEMEQGAGGAAGSERGGGNEPQLVVLDRRSGSGSILSITESRVLAELRGLNAPLAKGVAAGDLDGDGFNEVVIATQDGRIGYWNLSGSATPGWPKDVDPEPFATEASPLVAQLDATPSLEIVTATGSGRLFALDPAKKPLPGWPLATGAGQRGSPALLDVDGGGDLDMVVGDADSLLYAFDLPGSSAAGSPWPVWGADAGRSFALVTRPATGSVPPGKLLVAGSLRCYPNPAKRSPVTVAFQLSQPSHVTLTVYDASGRRVGEVSKDGLTSDNALVWDADRQAPGLYLGRLEIAATGGSESHLVHIGVLR